MKINKKQIMYWVMWLTVIIFLWGSLPAMYRSVKEWLIRRNITQSKQCVLEAKNERNILESKQIKQNKKANTCRESIVSSTRELLEFNNIKIWHTSAGEEKEYETNMAELERKAIDELGINKCISNYIRTKCAESVDQTHCFKYTLGVVNAESGLFKNWYKNNYFGIMFNGKIRSFENIYENIDLFIKQYNTYRYKNETPSQRLTRSKYCVSGCENWVKNVQYVLDIMNK